MITVSGAGLDDYPIEPTIFSDATSQVWKLPLDKFSKFVTIKWVFEFEGEIMHLAQLKMLLDKQRIGARLYMPYLPYARQDKLVDNEQTFALRTFTKIINSLKFIEVSAIDPHSNRAHKLRHFSSMSPINFIEAAIENLSAEMLCFPDEGAYLKYKDTSNELPICRGHKKRDAKTGEILNVELIQQYGVSPEGLKVLIVDDICDGGRTFTFMADLLYEAGAKSVNLFVTHGIFSQGLGPLRAAGLEHIFTRQGMVTSVNNRDIGCIPWELLK